VTKGYHQIGARISPDLYTRVKELNKPIATLTREAILLWLEKYEPVAKERFKNSVWVYRKKRSRPSRAQASIAINTTIREDHYKRMKWVTLVLDKTQSEMVREALELYLST